MVQSKLNKFSQLVDSIEETSIAACLGLMTLVTFANVVARYAYNDNILWALELTVFLFAWLILMGASYAVKHHIHIGVDLFVNMAPPKIRKVMAIISVSACLAFSILLLKGSWDYWYPFITDRAWLETDDIPMPEFLMFLSDTLNEGEAYEKLPRFIPYAALPLGMGLITFRFLQIAWHILKGDTDKIIAGHEAENDLAEATKNLSESSLEGKL